MNIYDLPHRQREAAQRLIETYVAEDHHLDTLTVVPSWGDRDVYVYCVGRHPAPTDAAQLINRSGFHARIGPRGRVKFL